MAQNEDRVKRGRPALAAEVSTLPGARLPAALHDAAIAEARRREVSVARVVREALEGFLYLQKPRPPTSP